MSIRTVLALAAALWLSPLAYAAAQGSASPPPTSSKGAPAAPRGRLPVLAHFRSPEPAVATRIAPAREALAADRDLTSEKIAIVVVLVVVAVVIIRAVK